MFTRKGSCAAVAALVFSCVATLAHADVVIDDFRTGAVQRAEVQCGTFDESQITATAGGVRRTRLLAGEFGSDCGSPAGHAGLATVTIAPHGPLVVSSDYRITHRLELIYGQDLARNNAPLNLDFTEGGLPDRVVRVKFPAMDLVENFVLTVFMNDGSSRSACAENLSPHAPGFTMEFPLASFAQALGVADYADVDYFVLIAQTGSAMGANDFAIDSIVVASGHEPGAWLADCR